MTTQNLPQQASKFYILSGFYYWVFFADLQYRKIEISMNTVSMQNIQINFNFLTLTNQTHLTNWLENQNQL